MSELRSAIADRRDWPSVSVVMPIRNEAEHLQSAVESILSQDYPLPFDVCLAVAPSDDGTESVAAALADRSPRISVVANPAGVTPAGLNAAIGATTGEVVVRVDGHAELSPGYIRRAVETMRRTGAVNVGGIQAAIGLTPVEQAIAAAMTSWMGTGGSRFHVGGHEGPVDTVYLGVFDRAAGDAVGWFDERLVRNQDYELNIRLRAAGGTVWLDPALSVSYRPRGTLRALARQYFEYGFWKGEVLRMHPGSLRLRQAIPPIAMIGVAALTVAALRRPRMIVGPLSYALVVGTAARRAAPHRPWITAAAMTTMHASWAAGAVWGRVAATRGRSSERRQPSDPRARASARSGSIGSVRTPSASSRA